ncbi:MAG: DUF6209 family protein [Myxococcaceae bacterium]
MYRQTLVMIAAVSIAACGPQELDLEAGAQPAAATTEAAGLRGTETVITFHDDWGISRSNLFIEGGTVRVVYDPDRLPQCRGDSNGRPAWGITGYYRINDGPIGSFEAGGASPSNGTQEPVFTLTEKGTLSLWFQVTNRWGCSHWDSNFGKNFTFEIASKPTVHFNKDGSVLTDGIVGSTPEFTVDYDLERLPECRATYAGHGAWDIIVYYRFDGGEVTYKPLSELQGTGRVKAPAKIPIPAGANQVELWFMNSDRAGCARWDSNLGENYTFRVN